MPDVFASSTEIFTAAVGQLAVSYLGVIGVIIALGFGFHFLWKIVGKGKRAVK